MIWSISGDKQFRKCPRQWYYSNVVSDKRVKKDEFRKEVTILAYLQNIQAWRGSIVDDIISRLLINAINKKRIIQKDYYLNEAAKTFESQLNYARQKTYREGKNNSEIIDFGGLLEIEFGRNILEEDLKIAKQEIMDALNNLLDDKLFIEYLQSADHLISQRPLIYSYDRFTVKAIPDLMLIFTDKPPHIVDWKVHTYGTNSYDEQLVSYAIALNQVARAKPHVDFPSNIKDFQLKDYKLTEYQLLHPDRIRRNYVIDDESLERFSDKLSRGLMEMYMAGCHQKYSQVTVDEFPTTDFVENCKNCPFTLICKQADNEIRNKHLQN